MVFSFAVAVLVAARSISKRTAFQIFVGTTSLPHRLTVSFSSGLHAAFYSSMSFLAIAAVLSATRFLRRHPSLGTRAAEVAAEVGAPG